MTSCRIVREHALGNLLTYMATRLRNMEQTHVFAPDKHPARLEFLPYDRTPMCMTVRRGDGSNPSIEYLAELPRHM